MQGEWTVKGSELNKKVRLGDPWPKLEPVRTEATDKCGSCKMKLKGRIVLEIDTDGQPVKIICVKEVVDG